MILKRTSNPEDGDGERAFLTIGRLVLMGLNGFPSYKEPGPGSKLPDLLKQTC